MKKFKISTLGCRTNQYESEAYRSQLLQMGLKEASGDEEADICIVNSCTVTDAAEKDSKYHIRSHLRKNPAAKIVVTGCASERDPQAFKEINDLVQIIPNSSKEHLVEQVFPEKEDIPEFAIQQFEAHTRAFVKVQDGCNSFCTYCIIPYVRGRSRSRDVAEIILEVEGLIANGYKEIVLTGINIGDFDGNVSDGSIKLCDLVKAVDKVPGLQRLRLSSIDPDEVDEALLEAIINGRTTCPSMHIVLQSGSNVTLKKMNRKYTRQMFLSTIDRLKAAHPDFTFTTDVIVGFPGETTEDFQETIDVMQEVKFAKVHMFPYSVRPRTRAALYPNKVPQDVIKERKQELLRIAEKHAFDLREQFLGSRMSVLTENRMDAHPGLIFGHTDNFLTVAIPSDTLSPNEIVEVELIENTAYGLIGKLL